MEILMQMVSVPLSKLFGNCCVMTVTELSGWAWWMQSTLQYVETMWKENKMNLLVML